MLVTTRTLARLAAAMGLALGLAGCAQKSADTAPAPAPTPTPAVQPPGGGQPPADEVTAERAKLSPEDRALVDAQEWCVISKDERLGSMGPPLKLTVKGQPVFVCCKGCKKGAEANPDKTLAALAELKAKAAKGKTGTP
jgi:hypothetical protein